MNETLRRMKEAANGTAPTVTEDMNDPNGYFASMFEPGPSPMGHGAREISLQLIDPWRDAEHDRQPFKPYSADKLAELAENIRQNGVISPIRLRPSPFEKGRYQILAGHNRVAAAKLAGLKTVPAELIQANDDEARLILVDSNLYQRDHLLPSEKAFAYKMRLESIKRKAGRPKNAAEENSCQLGTNSRADEKIAETTDESARTIQRFIRLTYLLPPLLDMVDAENIPFTAGVSVSFLSSNAQTRLYQIMCDNAVKNITRSQGEELKAFREELSEETILRILGKSKKSKVIKPQNLKLQLDYSPAMVRRLAKDEKFQARIRAMIDAYIKESYANDQ